jgi:hypothetical protein
MTNDAIEHLTTAINRLAQALEAGGVSHSTPPAPPPSPSRPLPAAGESRLCSLAEVWDQRGKSHKAGADVIGRWALANGMIYDGTNLPEINRRRVAMAYKPFEWDGT